MLVKVKFNPNKQKAMDINDLMTLKALDKDNSMSPYEQYMVGYKQNKAHTSGVGVAGLVLGTVGTAAAIGAWIFAPIYASSKSSQAKEAAMAAERIANVQNQGLRDLIGTLATTVAAERAERIAGDVNLTNTVNDSVSGSQQGTLTAQQAAELSAVNSVMQQTYSDFVTGRASLNPTPVSLYSSPQPCNCPASGCGCNG